MRQEEYNEEPVWYCRTCYSLRIFNSSGSDYDIDGDPTPCYCDACGSVDIAVTEDNGIEEVIALQKSREKELSKRIKRK